MTKVFFLLVFLGGLAHAVDDSVLAGIENKINDTLEEKVQLSVEKNQLESQISELQLKIKERKVILVKRLKALYSLKKFRWGELLLDSDMTTIDRNIKILGNLNAFDYELFKEYNSSLKLLAQSRKNLADTEQLLQSNIRALQQQQFEFKKIEDVRIQSLQRDKISSLLTFKGQLSRPLEGFLSQEFGTMHVKDQQFYLLSRGEIYKTKKASAVRAIGLGVVIFRDLLAGWRETLIIQHDDNYYTVYAGLKIPAKAVGDHVAQDEVIGLTAGDQFYFELRHYDNPINPKTWYREHKDEKK